MKRNRVSDLVVALFISLASMPLVSLATDYFSDGPYTFTLDEYGNATITDFDSSYSGALTIRNMLGDHHPVTAIGDSAFRECRYLTSITVPDSVTTIGKDAFFMCQALTNMVIGVGVTSIGSGAFSGSMNLQAVFFKGNKPSGSSWFVSYDKAYVYWLANKSGWSSTCDSRPTVETLLSGDELYILRCSAASGSMSIPESLDGFPVVRFLGDGSGGVFQNCTGLKSITIPNTVSIVGPRVFSGCSGLTNVTLGASVQEIGPYAFAGCSSLPNVALGASVQEIGDSAFLGCSGLTNVMLGASVQDIGPYAFAGCSGLKAITIPHNCAYMHGFAFQACTSLRTVTCLGNAPSADSTVFSGDANITVYHMWGTTGWGATFAYMPTALLPLSYRINSDGTVTITRYSGSDDAVAIPLSEEGMPVTAVGPGAFSNSFGLVSVTIPSGVTNIGNSAFAGCGSLIAAYFDGNKPSGVGTNVFSGAAQVTVYYLPAASGWDAEFASRPAMPIPFGYASNNGEVTITGYFGTNGVEALPPMIEGLPVTGIGTGAFAGNTSLVGVAIPHSVTVIGNDAFRYCVGLANLDVGDSDTTNRVTAVADYAFYGCSGLKSIVIGAGVTTFGYATFRNCTGLTSVTLNNYLKDFDARNVFPDAYASLKTLALGEHVGVIGSGAFRYCTGLTSVTLNNDLSNFDARDVFPDAYANLKSVVIGEHVGVIGSGAFLYCTGLTSVTLNNDLSNFDARDVFPDAYANWVRDGFLHHEALRKILKWSQKSS